MTELSDIQQRRQDWMIERYDQRLRQIAAGLRRLSEEVVRNGTPQSGDHLWAAQQVVHDVAWGVANLHLDILLSCATDIERSEQNE